ncbi:RNase H domain-containing protein [Trichonephila clavipes]|nr:RNase H domain-containing protein [Trichonephila clavipes]
MKRVLQHRIHNAWQESWDLQTNNKLHCVKPVIGGLPVMPMQRTDVKLTRLRIGHTRFTYRHLLLAKNVSCASKPNTHSHPLTLLFPHHRLKATLLTFTSSTSTAQPTITLINTTTAKSNNRTTAASKSSNNLKQNRKVLKTEPKPEIEIKITPHKPKKKFCRLYIRRRGYDRLWRG